MNRNFNSFIEEAAAKRCPEGKYYCYDKKKCMPIPKGKYIGPGGWLRTGHSHSHNGSTNGNGNGNGNNGGNGHSSGGNGNGGNGGGE